MDGVALTDELLYGKYTLTETSTGEAYLLDAAPQEIFVKDHHKVVELALQNNKKTGQIKIIKTDSETRKPIKDVVFEVMNSDEEVVAILVTGKDGTAITEPLPYGDYAVKEKVAKAGYILDEAAYEIMIREHEMVYELALQNTPIPPKPDKPDKPDNPGNPDSPGNPKTGDDFNLILWIVIAGASAVALITLGIRMRHRKTREEENRGA
jgi:uncharacterized surface anchored protein